MNKNIISIENFHHYNLLVDSREIFLSGFDEEGSLDYRVTCNFIKNLRYLEIISKDPIIIHQFSIGGDWQSGMAIYDAIKQSPCNFLFICYGVAASMGAIIPQAVHEKGFRISHKNCDWLIHEGDLTLDGIPARVKSNLEYLEYNKKVMYDILSEACGSGEFFANYTTYAKVKSYLKSIVTRKTDWCLNSSDALHYGFVDYILDDEIKLEDLKGEIK